jgi:hypothetical protein
MKPRLLAWCLLIVWPACLASAGTVLVHRNNGWRIADWKYRFGHEAPAVPDGWQQPEFVDRGWHAGKGSFAHGAPIRFGTDAKAMRGATTTLYLRTTFLVSDRTKITHPILDVNCSGGFVAWLNGVRVAARDVPAQLGPNARATASRKADAGDYESFPLPDAQRLLRDGFNVLAIQALSADVAAASFMFDAGLIDTRNLAHNKRGSASTVGSEQNRNKQFLMPFNGVDGSHLTFYRSDLAAPQWFSVDLGREMTIDKVRFYWWGDRTPADFTVTVSSDSSTWTSVHTAREARKSVRTDVVFPARAARHVRIHVTRMSDDKNGLFFGELEVHGPGTDFEPSEFASLSTGRPATASSETKPGSFHGAAEMAVNGHGLSWWTSAPADPQWLAVDLGARQPINRVRVYAKDNVKAFTIQVSDDGRTWTDVSAREAVTRIANGDVKAIFDRHFNAEITARHVRFLGTEREKPDHGYGIVEFAVFRDRQKR